MKQIMKLKELFVSVTPVELEILATSFTIGVFWAFHNFV